MAIVSREKPDLAWLAKSQADWGRACELLKEARYKLVAEFLHKVQIENEQTGNVILADILAAIRQICLACDQCQAEVEWHWQAYAEASGRERELRQQLLTILELVGETGMLEAQTQPVVSASFPTIELRSSVPAIPPFIILHNLWQRLQETLGWGSTSQLVQPEASIGWVEAAGPPAPEGVQALEASPIEVEVEQEKPGSASLVVHCLGPFRVYQDHTLITNWSSGKGKAIFKYLVANRSRPIHKDVLMDLFWRNADLEAARNNLNVAIYSLRQSFKMIRPNVSCILFHDEHYMLNPTMTVWVDFEHFIQAYQAGRTLEKQGQLAEAIRAYELAEGLYQGDFLEEDPYEDWPIIQRESLKDSYLVILERLSRYYFEEKRYTTCIHLCQKILAKDDCREDAHRRLMQCYSCQGQIRLALRQYHLCVEALAKVLEVSPAPETVALYNQIREREAV